MLRSSPRSSQLVGSQDPYVVLEIKDSKCGKLSDKKIKTKIHDDGGRDPIFNECFEFDIVDAFEISIQCFDKDLIGSDDLIGETTFALMDVFKTGLSTSYVPLTYPKKKGIISTKETRMPAGELLCVFHFAPNPVEGTPWGWRYPNQVAQIAGFRTPKVEKEFDGVGAMPPEKSWAVPGRMIFTCVEMDDVKGKDAELKAYVKIKLGKEEGGERRKTNTYISDETGRDVKIEEEFVFDIADPNEIKQDDEIELEIEVYDDHWTDTLLCYHSLKLKNLAFLAPYELQDVWLELKVAGDDDLNGRIRFQVLWEPAVVGLVRVTLNSATGLKDGGLLDVDKNDPYVGVKLGDGNKDRSITCDDSGVKADFNGEELLVWVNGMNWKDNLVFTVYDDNMLRDAFLGKCELDVCSLMGGTLPNISVEVKVPLNGVAMNQFGEKETKAVTRAIAELLGEDEDNIEDLKTFERGFIEETKQPPGLDVTFNLRKALKKGMKWGTNAERMVCVGKLWEEREKIAKEIDPKPTVLLDRLDFIMNEAGGKIGLLHSLHGRIQSIAAQEMLLGLGGLAVDRNFYEAPTINVTSMKSYDLTNEKGKEQKTDPELHMEVDFVPSGLLIVQVVEGRDLRNTEWVGKTDNYIVVKAKGVMGKKNGNGIDGMEKRGRVVKGGGKDCDFGDEFSMDICHHRSIEIEVWDDDMGKDDMIGRVDVDLGKAFRRGVVDDWFPLTFDKKVGCLGGKAVPIPAGELHVVLTFFGEDGIKYPVKVGKDDELAVARLEKKHAGEGKDLRKKYDDLKEDAKLNLVADRAEFLMLRAERWEKEENELKLEFDRKKEGRRLDLIEDDKKPRDEDGNLLDEDGIALKAYMDGNRDKTAGTAFELMSPLEQEEFEREKWEALEERIRVASEEIEKEYQGRLCGMVEARQIEEGGGGGGYATMSEDDLVRGRMAELEGDYDRALVKLDERHKMEVSGSEARSEAKRRALGINVCIESCNHWYFRSRWALSIIDAIIRFARQR